MATVAATGTTSVRCCGQRRQPWGRLSSSTLQIPPAWQRRGHCLGMSCTREPPIIPAAQQLAPVLCSCPCQIDIRELLKDSQQAEG